jgi:hypothetical protein
MNKHIAFFAAAIVAAIILAIYAFTHPQAHHADIVAVFGSLAACAAAMLALIQLEKKADQRARTEAESGQLTERAISINAAIDDCMQQYMLVLSMNYTHRDARAHLRAYIKAKHQFLPDTQASIQRCAIQAATIRYNNMKDINARPSYN